MSKEALIEKILSDAKKSAESLVKDAEESIAERLDRVRKDLDAYRQDQKALSDQKAKEVIERKLIVANLDARKTVLHFKRTLVNQTYENVLNALCNMKDAEYIAFVSALLAKNAEEGDAVVISERDVKRITPALLAKIAKEKGISLTLSDTRGSFRGGVVLQSASYDKNLTFESLTENLRAETETEVVQKLF